MPPEEYIKREEFSQSLGRIHDRIDKIGETTIKIETAAQLMKESTDKICGCVYGTNGNDGLITKITRLFERVSLHTKLITTIFFSIMGIAFLVIRESLTKKGG